MRNRLLGFVCLRETKRPDRFHYSDMVRSIIIVIITNRIYFA